MIKVDKASLVKHLTLWASDRLERIVNSSSFLLFGVYEITERLCVWFIYLLFVSLVLL